MRITGGVLAGLKLPVGFANHVRPTTDRVRESLMNHLNHQYGLERMHVLDLFSGSGIMAMEFLSYGAAKVVSVDRDFRNYSYQKELQKSQESFKDWQILKRDVFTFLGGNQERFDLIFADPPYDLANLHRFPEQVLPHVKEGGIFLFEHQPQLVLSVNPTHMRSYGSTNISIFEKS